MGCELHLAAQMYFKDPVLKNSQPHEARQTARSDFSFEELTHEIAH